MEIRRVLEGLIPARFVPVNIDEVIRETTIGIFSTQVARDNLVLKGGTGLRLGEGITNRISLDIDLSTEGSIPDPERFFQEITKALENRFDRLNLDVIDPKYSRRPKSRGKRKIEKWGGWNYTFKLSGQSHRGESPGKRIRQALVPNGSPSQKIEIQISEYEYCAVIDKIFLDGVEIYVYSPVLQVLEKIRAICQQHPDYKRSLNKNRARDYYDIYSIVSIHRREKDFSSKLAEHFEPVFHAKEVPLELLTEGTMFDSDFTSGQELGFATVRNSVFGDTEDFSFYVEQLKLLVASILQAREKQAIP